MNQPKRRLWSIDCIAAVCGLAALFLVWMSFHGPEKLRGTAAVRIPLFAVLCIGMFFRINIIRIFLMLLLAGFAIYDGFKFVVAVGETWGLFSPATEYDPEYQLFSVAIDLGLLGYLGSFAVRQEFQRKRSEETEEQ
ncbi:MAG: hypothetical protein KatS3mg105_1043 [Gemmatales bacterium]|nr:MAG: hypothetical protein KatS3mg105_1043 [Gemmatales bacterium]